MLLKDSWGSLHEINLNFFLIICSVGIQTKRAPCPDGTCPLLYCSHTINYGEQCLDDNLLCSTIQNVNFMGEQTFNEKSRIRIIEQIVCLILIHPSHPFSTWTGKNMLETIWHLSSTEKKNIHSDQFSRLRFSISQMPEVFRAKEHFSCGAI